MIESFPMQPNPTRKRFPKWAIAPVLLGVVAVPLGMLSVQLCACVHPLGKFVDGNPMELTEGEIKQRLLKRIPAGTPRSEIRAELIKGFGYSKYETSCKYTAMVQQLDCTFPLEQGLYGLREKGVAITFSMDNSDRLMIADAIQYTRYHWNWRPAGG